MKVGNKVKFNKGLYCGEKATIKEPWSFQANTENNQDNEHYFDWVVELENGCCIAAYESELNLIKDPIQVWEYEDCPDEYKKSIEDPSDLDWVIFVPNTYYYDGNEPIWLSFLTTKDRDPTEIKFANGSKLLLMYHS